MSLAAGEVFAGYRIMRVLGVGGMGEVYLVDHPRLPRQDALKVLPSAATADQGFHARFIREADLASKLSHPNILSVYDRGEENGRLWISMEFVQGADASQLVRDRYPSGMPQADVVDIVTAVASALDYAHHNGLLHRDVKPANVLIANPDTPQRRIFLADFGIARRMDDVTGLTSTNTSLGTVAYAAPEQMMGHVIDGRADQYALACTAFHLLTGSLPYESSNAVVVITKHVTEPPPSIAQRRPEYAYLEPIFAKALAKRPEDRYPSCLDFARELSRGLASIAEPSDVVVPPAEPYVDRMPPRPGPPTNQAWPPWPPPDQAPGPWYPPPVARTPWWGRAAIVVPLLAAALLVVALVITGVVLWSSDSTPTRSVANGTASSTRSSAFPSFPSRATSSAATATADAGPTRVTIDGNQTTVSGTVVCAAMSGQVNVAIGQASTGIAVVMTDGDTPVVTTVALGNVDGMTLSVSSGQGEATAQKNGNSYVITGTGVGIDMSNPMSMAQKHFELEFTCP